jgi:transcriptional regulator with XRE-family HTH domain
MQIEQFQRALGSRIRDLRKKQGWSQEEFADRCDIHRSYMGAIERGEYNLTLATLYKLAKTLQLTVSGLLKGII